MFIWGFYEFFGIDCVNKLNTTLIYNLALVHWLLVWIMFSHICIKLVYTCILAYYT